MSAPLLTLTSLLLSGLSGCSKDSAGTDTSIDTSPVVVDDTGDTGGEACPCDATITGTVKVDIYDYDADGNFVDVDESSLSSFPFGAVWVAASDSDEAILGSDTIKAPSLSGDSYSLDVSVDEAQDLTLYGRLDYWVDGIIGSTEPVGTYPQPVSISATETQSGLDITILAYWDVDGSDGGGTGGPGCTTVDISGDVLITRSYAGGDVATMLLGTDGSGPYHSTWDTPTASGSGASAAYTLPVCAGEGEHKLVAAWDSDGDDLITAADTWGAYISEPDTDGNPISVGSSDLSGHDIQVPLGDESPFGAFPFLSISGSLSVQDGSFADYPEGTTLYVAALKYRPDGDLAVSKLKELAYGMDSWDYADFSTESSLPYSMTVPAGTIVYLWAYADIDGDGVVNGPGEPVASYGGSTGKLPTGSEDTTADLELGAYSAE